MINRSDIIEGDTLECYISKTNPDGSKTSLFDFRTNAPEEEIRKILHTAGFDGDACTCTYSDLEKMVKAAGYTCSRLRVIVMNIPENKT